MASNFGGGASEAHLQVESYGSWNEFRVLISGTALPSLNSFAGKARLRFSGDPQEGQVDTIQGTAGEVPAVSFNLRFLPWNDPHALRRMNDRERAKEQETHRHEVIRPRPDYDSTIDSLSIGVGRGPSATLVLGNMAQPLAALRACVDHMIKSWGGNPEVQKSLSWEAVPLKATVRRVQSDYPGVGQANGLNAYVPVRLSIDAAGRPSQCVVQTENVNEAFKEAVCHNLQGRFEPARDQHGHPVASIFHTAVIYRIGY